MSVTTDAANYDEDKIPEYSLPDPLISNNGTPITSAEDWIKIRRPEILSLFENHVYGKQPSGVPQVAYEQILHDANALDGKATLREVKISFPKKNNAPEIFLLLWTPNTGPSPHPAFLGLNFRGNHTTHSHSGIKLATIRDSKSKNGRPGEEADRGKSAGRWQVEKVIQSGYALATIYCGDIDPDFHDGFKNGVHALFPDYGVTDGSRDSNAWGTISGWSWGLSRALDYMHGDPTLDQNRVAVIGHSRLGKTSLWAGAVDKRFAMVISNNSGCGGAALNRRAFGETVQRINTSFPHWFCDQFKSYNANENEIPVDQHMLIALAAPRPVYVASAEDDRWADPKGEWLSLNHAAPVFSLFGKNPLRLKEQPAVDAPVHADTAYHIRKGRHDINAYDWEQYLKFADRHLK